MRSLSTGERLADGTGTWGVWPFSAGGGFFYGTGCLLQSFCMHPQNGRLFGYERNRERSWRCS
jgi:hypothetical protein